jgi:hypothetical protein
MKLRMHAPQRARELNTVQQAMGISLKGCGLQMNDFAQQAVTVLGAGGRAFKSPRPDQ